MKVAIIHYWLVGMRGGEKVLEALCEMYPGADIFTHVYVPEMVSDRIRQHRIIPTFINALPRAARMYKTYLPLMPLALEQCDLPARLRSRDPGSEIRTVEEEVTSRPPTPCTSATATRRCDMSGTCITSIGLGLVLRNA